VPRPEDDKSKFLAQAGFTQENPDQLKQAILSPVQAYDAVSDRQDKYGTYYRVEGPILGPRGALFVVTVIDTIPAPDDGEDGCILEVFNALGELVDVVTVPQSAIAPLRPDDILTVRSRLEAVR